MLLIFPFQLFSFCKKEATRVSWEVFWKTSIPATFQLNGKMESHGTQNQRQSPHFSRMTSIPVVIYCKLARIRHSWIPPLLSFFFYLNSSRREGRWKWKILHISQFPIFHCWLIQAVYFSFPLSYVFSVSLRGIFFLSSVLLLVSISNDWMK